MPTKPLELPLKVARAFARDMRAVFEAETQLEQDAIASRQLHALWAFQGPRDKRLRLAETPSHSSTSPPVLRCSQPARFP